MNSSKSRNFTDPLIGICTCCDLEFATPRLLNHLTSCKKKSKLLIHYFKLSLEDRARVVYCLEKRIRLIRKSINFLSCNTSSLDSKSLLFNLQSLNKKLEKLITLKNSSEFSASQLKYLEKMIFLTSNIEHSPQKSKVYHFTSDDHLKDHIGNHFNLFYEYTSINQQMTSIAIDGNLVAYSNSKFVSIYDSNKNLVIFSIAKNDVKQVDVIERYRHLVFSYKDYFIKIINFHDQTLVCKLQYSKSKPNCFNHKLNNFLVSEDKEIILANFDNKFISIFNVFGNEKIMIKRDNDKDSKKYENNTFFVVSSKNDFFIYFDNNIVLYSLAHKTIEDKIMVMFPIHNLALLDEDNKILYTADKSLRCYSIATKTFLFNLEVNSKFYLEKTGNFIYFKSGMIFDLKKNEYKNDVIQTGPLELMQTNSAKNFSWRYLDSKKVVKDRKKYFLEMGKLRIISHSELKIPLNIMKSDEKIELLFKKNNIKVLVTSIETNKKCFDVQIIEKIKENLMIKLTYSCITSCISLSKDLNYVYLQTFNRIEMWETNSQKLLDEYFVIFEDSISHQITNSKKYIITIDKFNKMKTFKAIKENKMNYFNVKTINFKKDNNEMVLILKNELIQVLSFSDNIIQTSRKIERLDLEQIFHKFIGNYILITTSTKTIAFNKKTYHIDFTFEYKKFPIFQIKYSFDESFLVLVTKEKALIMVLENPPEQKVIFNHTLKCVSQISFSGNNQKFFIAGPSISFIYLIKTSNLVGVIDHYFPMTSNPKNFSFYSSDFFIVCYKITKQQTESQRKTDNKSLNSLKICILDIDRHNLVEVVDFNHESQVYDYIDLSKTTLTFYSRQNLILFEIFISYSYQIIQIKNPEIYQGLLSRVRSSDNLNFLKNYLDFKKKYSYEDRIRDLHFTRNGSTMILLNDSCARVIDKSFDKRFCKDYYNPNIKNIFIFKDKYLIMHMNDSNFSINYLYDNEIFPKISETIINDLNITYFDGFQIISFEGKKFLYDPDKKHDENLFKLIGLFGTDNKEINCFLSKSMIYFISVTPDYCTVINLEIQNRYLKIPGRLNIDSLIISKYGLFLTLSKISLEIIFIFLLNMEFKIILNKGKIKKLSYVSDTGYAYGFSDYAQELIYISYE